MKRLNKTSIALVTAGALGLGTVPFVQAQELNSVQDLGVAPDATGEGERYVEQPEERAPLPTQLNEQNGPEAVVGEKATEGAEWVSENAPANPAEATNTNQLTGTAEPTKDNSWNRPATTGTVTETLRPPATTTENNTTAIVLGTLGALAGLGLIIAGVNYFVNKDGDLVKDPNRVNEPASPAEKAESDQLKKDHAEEIAKQVEAKDGAAANANGGNAAANTGAAANGERGMNASTGVTQLPAGLVALLLLALVGAAGYAFTRRETA